MGDWNKSQPSASTDLLPYALPLDRNVNLSRFIETFTSSNHEVLHDVQEVEKSRRQLCERIEMEIPPSDVGKISVMNNSLAVLSAQQMQLVDLMRSMSEQLRLIQSMSVQIQQADNPYPSKQASTNYNDYDTYMDLIGYAICYGVILFSLCASRGQNFDVVAFHISRNQWKPVEVDISVYYAPFQGRAVVVGEKIYSVHGEEFIAFGFKMYKGDDGSIVYFLSRLGCDDYEPKEEETSMDESFSMVNRRRMARKEAGCGIAARAL
ncbi:unnamed protein product [Prunus armeniaca]